MGSTEVILLILVIVLLLGGMVAVGLLAYFLLIRQKNGTNEPAARSAEINKICPSCGAQNPADNNFCEQCGSKL